MMNRTVLVIDICVVPHAGTWIEIGTFSQEKVLHDVVPHAGTWIEMQNASILSSATFVVPHAGTWIEMRLPHAGRDQ